MPVRIGINGFGRIGRNVFRAVEERGDRIQIVAVNDVAPAATLAHLLRHDSVLGAYPGVVQLDGDDMVVDGRRVRTFAETDPARLPWGELGVEIVVEATGKYRDAARARAHLDQGAGRVLITAPGRNEDVTICMGVNESAFDPARHRIISNASCTTNCLAPVVKVLNDEFGVEMGMMTTVHAYTGDQHILDAPHKDLRRARAAATSIIPTTTGAAKAVALVLPELAGRLHGMALRVPTPNVSVVDLVAVLSRPVTVEQVNAAFRAAAAGPLRGILGVTDEQLVSCDFLRDSRSSIVDLPLTMSIGERMVKVLSWYDNEWGYSCRVVDLIQLVAAMQVPAALAVM